jgi:hypothetical protein
LFKGVAMSKLSDNASSHSSEKIQTTIGDLIEAVTQIALEAGKTEQEGYKLASLTLEKIFLKNRSEVKIVN